MKTTFFGIVAVGLAVAALTPLAGAAAPPPCATGSLKVSFNLIAGSQGAGNVEYTLKVTNGGTASCVLGKPTITLLSKTGAPLPSHSHAAKTSVVVGAHAHIGWTYRFSPDVAGTGDNQTGQCQPTAYKVKVRFARASGSVVGPVRPPTPVCERGTLTTLNAPFPGNFFGGAADRS